MELSVRLAQEIVRSMHDVLHQEINFMNEEGIIIASTDAARLHQRHKGAQIVIETKKQLVIREDHRYANTRKGINMPVFFDAQVIGVIGITGEEKDVLPYGQILQKMTQILVRDAYDRDIRHQKRRSEQLWIEELLQAKGEDSLPLAFDLPKEPCCFVYAAFVQTLDEEHIAWLHRMMEAMPYAESIVKKALYPQELVLVLKAASSKTLTDMLAELQAQGIEGGGASAWHMKISLTCITRIRRQSRQRCGEKRSPVSRSPSTGKASWACCCRSFLKGRHRHIPVQSSAISPPSRYKRCWQPYSCMSKAAAASYRRHASAICIKTRCSISCCKSNS